MNLLPSVVLDIFEILIDRIGRKTLLEKNETLPAIIAYSGGRDSTISLAFFNYLSEKYDLLPPRIFHLNHQIRDNLLQEEEISSFLNSKFSKSLLLKKKSHNLREE